MASDSSHTHLVILRGEVVTQLPAGVMCWCSKALGSPYLQQQLVKQFCHKKISLAAALFCVCLGPVSACGLAEPWRCVVPRWWSPVLPLSTVSAVWLQELRTVLLLGLPELQCCCSPLWKHSAEGVQAVPRKTNWVRRECFLPKTVSNPKVVCCFFFSSVYVPCGVADFCSRRALHCTCAWMLPVPWNFKTGRLWIVVIWAVQS